MTHISKIKSTFGTIMLGTMIATCVPATRTEAFSLGSFNSCIKNHKLLCFAALAIPILAHYARKSFQSITKKSGHTEADQDIDYVDKFADTLNKTKRLIDDIFFFARMVAAYSNE